MRAALTAGTGGPQLYALGFFSALSTGLRNRRRRARIDTIIQLWGGRYGSSAIRQALQVGNFRKLEAFGELKLMFHE